ncbi:Ribonuclease I precursor [Pelagimonas phthalicica]|uniref:Ribonuclease I n=1 Tax=Pelagimonas phthalicica TaxID=1037362 RepID=A0A238JCH5_9RHOB|nr:ribonuclease T [Pelagimonas phthalicica]TDS93930.1 ribonuclease T2 [Pelagimonas phthalicica]SMX27546.1 Ribonuclease I precursor [Pelagimonas phthalicica]
MKRILLGAAALIFGHALPAYSQEPLEGWFIATEQCEAYQSKNRLTNPGDIVLIDHVAYDMIGINRPGGDWYQIRIDDAPVTTVRWVNKTCGVHVVAADSGGGSGGTAPVEDFEPQEGVEATDLLLALSWQPAFCEMKPSKTECVQVNDGLLPITETQLSLHGLWPQPRGNDYCGVSDEIRQLDKDRRWSELPAPELDDDTRERLAVAMPGTASFLDRHEWIKHGTCFFGDRNGDEYYDDTLYVLEAINRSEVGTLFAQNVGGTVTAEQIRAAFDTSFGAGAGERVQINCKGDQGRVLIQELKIALGGEITEQSDVGALIRAGTVQSVGCPSGVVDPAGLQ